VVGQDITRFTQIDRFTSLRMDWEAFVIDNILVGFNAVFLYVKFFRYVERIGGKETRLKVVMQMLEYASSDLMYFTFCLLILWIGFGAWAYAWFSNDVWAYRTLSSSVLNGIRFFVTEPPYDKMVISGRMQGMIFYVVWLFVMILVLVNVFIAILNDAYADVSTTLQSSAVTWNFATWCAESRGVKMGTDGASANVLTRDSEIASVLGVDPENVREYMMLADKDKDGRIAEDELNLLFEYKKKTYAGSTKFDLEVLERKLQRFIWDALGQRAPLPKYQTAKVVGAST